MQTWTERARLALVVLALGCSGQDFPAGEVQGGPRARAPKIEERHAQAERGPVGVPRILFGDLHVHTSYSIDAYLYGLPIFGGEGVHPPADACDFARHCAGLDFFALTDHAEALTRERWERSLENLRSCEAAGAGSGDLIPFAGFEWTQTSLRPEDHYGHKNVIYPSLESAALPPRPISALADDSLDRARAMWLVRGVEALTSVAAPHYADLLWWMRQLSSTPYCEAGVDTRELPADCQENAPTPAELFRKLDERGLPALVIPHGLAWGIHSPPGARLDNQLEGDLHDPERQRLIEVYSGHGSGERYDPVVAEAEAAALEGRCLEPSSGFLPCCWQAGVLVRERCADPTSAACESRVEEARQHVLRAGRRPLRVLPDASFEDWLDCDESRGAFKPAMRPRPRESAQFALALSRDGGDRRFRFGLVASSDIHTARAGSGYKQVARRGMSDVRGIASERLDHWLESFVQGDQEDPLRAQASADEAAGFRTLFDVERNASFLYPGGLVAVHARRPDRQGIWDALMRREAYGTSGPRILLWFDLLEPGGGRVAMGSAHLTREAPRFEVRAIGARKQRPGCPADVRERLGAARVGALCLDECHHPDDERHVISRIEVVRIRPQQNRGEPVEALIEDPWRTLPCPGEAAGCVAEFSDPDFASSARDAVYYVRALQEETPAINGAPLRTRFDPDGNASSVAPCYGGYRQDPEDDCLSPVQERAWSSPIFVDWKQVREDALVDRNS
jgi:hypothetical protein